jgi:tetratricopeptide (TPR) repeat protein
LLARLAVIRNSELPYKEAIEKVKKAIEIDPTSMSAFKNWCHYIIASTKKLPSGQRKAYLEMALEKAKVAFELGDSGYNLACCYALLNDKEKALNYLKGVLERKSADINMILQDDDWKNYLDDDDFKALIKAYTEVNF